MEAGQVAAILAEARSWVGTPYVPRALIKGVGVDCGGLLYKVYEPVFGPFAPFPQNYSADWALHGDRELYLDWIAPFTKQISRPIVGGFSVYHYGTKYAHGAIYTGEWYIHAWGRQREGRVTMSKPRAMLNIGNSKAFPPKHFEPV